MTENPYSMAAKDFMSSKNLLHKAVKPHSNFPYENESNINEQIKERFVEKIFCFDSSEDEPIYKHTLRTFLLSPD